MAKCLNGLHRLTPLVLSSLKGKLLFTHAQKNLLHISEKKLKGASGEAIQKDIPPPRMAACTVGAVVGEKDKKKSREIVTVSKNSNHKGFVVQLRGFNRSDSSTIT